MFAYLNSIIGNTKGIGEELTQATAKQLSSTKQEAKEYLADRVKELRDMGDEISYADIEDEIYDLGLDGDYEMDLIEAYAGIGR